MSSNDSTLSSSRKPHGGRRAGAGRKSSWPNHTAMKTMRLPAALEEELHRYARQRMAEINRDQAGRRHPDGPPPEVSQVRMEKISAGHFTIGYEKQTIGDVCRVSRDRWLACLYNPEADHHAFAEGQTREDAVATLLIQERSRWLNDHPT